MRLLVNRRYGGTNGSGFKDLYRDLSASGSRFVFRRSAELPTSITKHPWILSDAGVKMSPKGVITPDPSVEYANSPEVVLKEHRELVYVDVRLAATDSQGVRYSRLKRFYWSPGDKTWLPMEVVSLCAGDRRADEWF